MEYKNSKAYHCVMSADLRQLQNRRRYTLMAIDYHTQRGNAEDEKFFRDELALIDKRIKSLEKLPIDTE